MDKICGELPQPPVYSKQLIEINWQQVLEQKEFSKDKEEVNLDLVVF